MGSDVPVHTVRLKAQKELKVLSVKDTVLKYESILNIFIFMTTVAVKCCPH